MLVLFCENTPVNGINMIADEPENLFNSFTSPKKSILILCHNG